MSELSYDAYLMTYNSIDTMKVIKNIKQNLQMFNRRKIVYD